MAKHPQGLGYTLDYWRDQANAVMDRYGDDSEEGHSAEDEILAEFVRAVADGNVADPAAAAQALVRGLLDQERTRWYA